MIGEPGKPALSDAGQAAAKRLHDARKAAGYVSLEAFARAVGVPKATYQSHENGSRGLNAVNARAYADKLEVSLGWLLTGEGETPLLIGTDDDNPRAMIRVPEVDARAEAGSGGIETILDSDVEIAEWRLPATYLKAQTSAPKDRLRIVRVYGTSMVPLFRPGDRLLVDLSDRTPSPGGIFVLWDGLGIVVKQVEHVPYSKPARLRLRSANPDYGTYECMLTECDINGRVIGRWDWT